MNYDVYARWYAKTSAAKYINADYATGSQLLDEGSHLDDRLAHLADKVHHLAEDDAAEECLDVARAVEILRPYNLGDEKLRISNLDGIGTKAGHARHATTRK